MMHKKDIIRQHILSGLRGTQAEISKTIYKSDTQLWINPDYVRNLLRRYVMTDPEIAKLVTPRGVAPVAQPNGYAHEPEIEAEAKPEGVLTIDQIRALHDMKTVVFNALDSIRKDTFYTEHEFIRRHLAGKNGYRQILDSMHTSKYRGKSGGRVYFGHPESMQILKNEGTLL
jgi:hypothetical protein